MPIEPQLAFYERHPEPPGLEIRVNFGIFAGRPATPAEIDELGELLLQKVGEVSIVAEDRHEISPASEAAVYQVRVDLHDAEDDPRLEGRLVGLAEGWAHACVAHRNVELAP